MLGVYNPKILGKDKSAVQTTTIERGVYDPKILGKDKS